VSAVDGPVDLSQFSQLLASPKKGDAIRRVWRPLLAWVLGGAPLYDDGKSFNIYLELLSIMQTVLEFEWDRPFFRYWYAKCPKFGAEDIQKALNNLPQDPGKRGKWTDFRELVKNYVDDVKNYLQAEEQRLREAAVDNPLITQE
jgi:hypothetical protein